MSENKSIKRNVLAQDIMDLYLQGLSDDNETFFNDLDFYVRQVNDAYESILREEYLARYNELRRDKALQAEMVAFDSRWIRTERLELQKDEESGDFFVELKGKVFSFPYDRSGVGLQEVMPIKRNECNLIRSNVSGSWIGKHLPKTDAVLWWPEGNKIMFEKNCCKKVKVLYVPTADIELELEQGIAHNIKLMVLQMMQGAKNGFVADTTNDSNPNVLPQSETNKEQMQ